MNAPDVLTRAWKRTGIRFVIVGGINTVIGYALYALTTITTGSYLLGLAVAYTVGAGIAYELHRRLTFTDATGSWLRGFWTYLSVNAAAVALNFAGVPLLVHLGIGPLIAQPIVLVVLTLGQYVLHSRVTYRSA